MAWALITREDWWYIPWTNPAAGRGITIVTRAQARVRPFFSVHVYGDAIWQHCKLSKRKLQAPWKASP
eukprot:scaffold11066_cov18-Tisochrysis_lutea.AAC.2